MLDELNTKGVLPDAKGVQDLKAVCRHLIANVNKPAKLVSSSPPPQLTPRVPRRTESGLNRALAGCTAPTWQTTQGSRKLLRPLHPSENRFSRVASAVENHPTMMQCIVVIASR